MLDIRTVGIAGRHRPRAGGRTRAGKRGLPGAENAFHDHGILLRVSGDAIAMTPPLIVTEAQIGEIVDKVAKVIKQVA